MPDSAETARVRPGDEPRYNGKMLPGVLEECGHYPPGDALALKGLQQPDANLNFVLASWLELGTTSECTVDQDSKVGSHRGACQSLHRCDRRKARMEAHPVLIESIFVRFCLEAGKHGLGITFLQESDLQISRCVPEVLIAHRSKIQQVEV